MNPLSVFLVLAASLVVFADETTTTDVLKTKKVWNVPCDATSYSPFKQGCHTTQCKRVFQDNFANEEEVSELLGIAKRGMASLEDIAGPTIFDLNSGYVRDANALINVHHKAHRVLFEKKQYDAYRNIVERIRVRIMEEFGLEELWFTGPTFITRLIGEEGWEPKEIHDEYYHPHVDKVNTGHYDYSGLLYLADYGEDFEGGRFAFLDADNDFLEADTTHFMLPRKGRLAIFTAGNENLHQVQKVESGTRYCLSLWFTCDKRYYFKNFLDGEMHRQYTQSEEKEEL